MICSYFQGGDLHVTAQLCTSLSDQTLSNKTNRPIPPIKVTYDIFSYQNTRNRSPDLNVITSRIVPIKDYIGLGAKEGDVQRPAQVEHSNQSPSDPLILLNGHLTGRYFCHAYGDGAHQADQGVV